MAMYLNIADVDKLLSQIFVEGSAGGWLKSKSPQMIQKN